MEIFSYKLIKNTKLEESLDKVKQEGLDKVKLLEADIDNATDFIKNIEEGNLESELKGVNISEEKVSNLAVSLLSMRSQMKQIAEQERERNWGRLG